MRKIVAMLGLLTIMFAKEYVIVQVNKEFTPKKISIKAGDTLIFKNNDEYAHNMYTDNEENEFDLGVQRPNDDKKIILKAKGKTVIECAIHPNMILEVDIK